MPMANSDLFYLALYNSQGFTRQKTARLIQKYGPTLEPKHLGWEISDRDWEVAQRQHTALTALGIAVLSSFDLMQRHGPSPALPPFLFWRGRKSAILTKGIAVVGARRATASLSWVEDLAQWCGGHGIPVISGGALGVDSAAHRTILSVLWNRYR